MEGPIIAHSVSYLFINVSSRLSKRLPTGRRRDIRVVEQGIRERWVEWVAGAAHPHLSVANAASTCG